jgi:two-component system invasion response regulator UvrY
MLRILIADDHEMIRKGVKQILHEEFSSLETCEADDTNSLIEKATFKDWDIIISDISMPGGGGLFAIKEIHQVKPNTPILIISMYHDEEYISQAINLGASGFLKKDLATDELINAIKEILGGNNYFPS